MLKRPLGATVVVLTGWVLTACESQPVEPAATPAVLPATAAPLTKTQQLVLQLLERADNALAMQKLIMPFGDNALDLYRAVLRVEPTNARALEGLNKVADACVDLVQESLRGKQLDAANRHWQGARIAFPAHAGIQAMGAEIAKVRASIAPSNKPASPQLGPNAVALPAEALTAKSKGVEEQLQALAKRVQKSDESILIFARNDAEGRWIYKVMRESVGDYRIRGDIKIAAKPAIQFQTPF